MKEVDLEITKDSALNIIMDKIAETTNLYSLTKDETESKELNEKLQVLNKIKDEIYLGNIKIINNVIKTLPPEKVFIYRRGREDEGFEPQELKPKTLSTGDLLETLTVERNNSNKGYVFRRQNSFQDDYNKIKDSMEKRGAPEAQFKQLNEIYNRYVTYLNYIKYQEQNGFDVDDI